MTESPTTSRSPRPRRRAFTLVELLIVIGIIGVLVSILLPVMGRAREAAYSVSCLSQIRSIGQGLVLYGNANRLKIPPGVGLEDRDGDHLFADQAGYNYKEERDVHWSDYPFIGEYLPNPIKPGKIHQRAGRSGYTHEDRDTTFTCPADDSPGHDDGNGRFVSYAVLGEVWPVRNQHQKSENQIQRQYRDRLFRLPAVKSPSTTLFTLDAFASTYFFTTGSGWPSTGTMLIGSDRKVNASNRHGGQTNIALFDGGARTMPNSEETKTLGQAHFDREFKVRPTLSADLDRDFHTPAP